MLSSFQKFTRGVLAVICVFLAVLLTSLAFPNFERFHWYSQLGMTMISPLQSSLTKISGFFGGAWRHYIAISDAAIENEKLKFDLAEAKRRMIEMEDVRKENNNLHELLSMSSSLKKEGFGARVIASDVTAEFKTVTIDKGFNQGARKNMVVIGPGGLVGRIGKVANSESVVLLIADPNSAVDVTVQRTGARALLVGTSMETELKPFYSLSRLEYLRLVSNVADGDVVITSGLDKLFPFGIPVGTLNKVQNQSSGVFKGADVIPFVDLAQVKNVMVLK